MHIDNKFAIIEHIVNMCTFKLCCQYFHLFFYVKTVYVTFYSNLFHSFNNLKKIPILEYKNNRIRVA